MKQESSVHSDELVSLPKSALTHFVGSLKPAELSKIDIALAVSLGLDG